MKNPLIPMGAITGDMTTAEIDVMMKRYADQGLGQFLMYPRDGCEIEYLSDRWFEVCGDIIRAAERYGIDIWLYDEFNWPSGTCMGAVIAADPEFSAKCVAVKNGKCEIVETVRPGCIPENYADILNPDAVDLFIKLTHDVYYERFGEYFGSVIKGIFTDEPSMAYFLSDGSVYPYTKGLEDIYRSETGRDLFADILNPTSETDRLILGLTARLFCENYIGRINDWCERHGILMTGHLLSESNTHSSLVANGDIIADLRGFGLPGMDEIGTRTSIARAEWMTFGVLEAAIRSKSGGLDCKPGGLNSKPGGLNSKSGGLAELFALGPTDLVPARIEQMIWLTAMFGVDHYVLAVAASDARGNYLKNGYFNPMNYMNPWFEGFGSLGVSASRAAELAKKEIAVDVYVRYPLDMAIKHVHDEKRGQISGRTSALLSELTRRQYQWRFLAAGDKAPEDIPVINIDDSDVWNAAETIAGLGLDRGVEVYEGGELADELFVRRFTDGSFVIIDLNDSDRKRRLTVKSDGAEREIALYGRGHYVSGDENAETETVSEAEPEFALSIDRPDTLRCNLTPIRDEFEFGVTDRLDGVRMVVRDYHYDGEISIDDMILPLTGKAEALTPGIENLYRSTGEFTLLPGKHVVRQSKAAKSGAFLPVAFICGEFAAEGDRLYKLPEKVGCGDLRGILPQFAGKITLECMVEIPADAEFIEFYSSELFTRIYLNGVFAGESLAECRFEIPERLAGREVALRIEQFTTIGPVFGRRGEAYAPGEGLNWVNLDEYFPGNHEKCGVGKIRFTK